MPKRRSGGTTRGGKRTASSSRPTTGSCGISLGGSVSGTTCDTKITSLTSLPDILKERMLERISSRKPFHQPHSADGERLEIRFKYNGGNSSNINGFTSKNRQMGKTPVNQTTP